MSHTDANSKGPYRVGEPEDEDGSATVLDSYGNPMTADEIVALLNTYSKLAVGDMSALLSESAANADGVRPATLPEALAVLKALHSDRLSPAEKRELQEAIDFIKAATTPHEPPAPKGKGE